VPLRSPRKKAVISQRKTASRRRDLGLTIRQTSARTTENRTRWRRRRCGQHFTTRHGRGKDAESIIWEGDTAWIREGSAKTGDGAPDGIRVADKVEFKTGDGADTIGDEGVAVPAKDDSVELMESMAGDIAHEKVETNRGRRGLAEYQGPLPRRQREMTEFLRVEGPVPGAEALGRSVPDKVGRPALVMAVMKAEMLKGDQVSAKMLQLKVLTTETQRWKEEEQKRWDHRAEKRQERARKRRAAKKTKGAVRAVTQHDVLHAVSTRNCPPEDLEGPRRTDGVVYEPDFVMKEPAVSSGRRWQGVSPLGTLSTKWRNGAMCSSMGWPSWR
jgi:hypothetical protein